MLRRLPFVMTIALAGCTITTYSGDPKPPPPAGSEAAPAPTAHPSSSGAPRSGLRVTRLGLGQGGSDVAPKISGPIAFGNGTGGAFRGLAYVIPDGTTSMPDLGTLVPFATLYTDSFEVKSQDFSGGFPGALAQEEWFAIRYDGAFMVPADGTYRFKLQSDDGAVLHIDGAKIIDDGNQHTVRTATGQKELKAGRHRLRLDYFQTKKGAVALQLSIAEGGQERALLGTK